MNILASFLGDSIRTFFRRSEVRRAVQDITKSSSQFIPSVQLIGEDGFFSEVVRIESAYLGKQVRFSTTSALTPSQNVSSLYDVTKLGIDVRFFDTAQPTTPNLQEIVVNATEVVTTNNTDDSIDIETPVKYLTFSSDVKYLGLPETDLGFNIYYYYNSDTQLLQIRGENIEYIRSFDINTDTLGLDLDFTDLFPASCVVEDFDFYTDHNGPVDVITLPAATIREMYLAAWNAGFSLTTLDLSKTTFTYEYGQGSQGSLYVLSNVINLVFAPAETIKEMPFYISFNDSPSINSESIDTLLEILVGLNGSNGTTMWVGELWMGSLPEPTPYAITLIETLITRGASISYTQPVTE